MDLKDKFFAEYLKSLTPEQLVDLLGADTTFWEYCSDRDKFNSRDWRKLLQYDYGFFADKCDWEKLDDIEDWFILMRDCEPIECPILMQKCPWDDFDGYQWYKLVLAHLPYAKICRWGKLDRLAWHILLLTHPFLACHCSFGALSEADWAELIAKKPELAKYKPQHA